MYNDITVFFSGYNIKHFAILAIESFLLQYPEIRGNVVYFDDMSTDGTAEELLSRGIQVITWDNRLYAQYMEQVHSGTVRAGIHASVVRCQYIFQQSVASCKTGKILLCDGDTVTLDGGFLERYIGDGIDVVHSRYANAYTTPVSSNLALRDVYIQYLVRVSDEVFYRRFHPYHLYMDLSSIGDVSKYIRLDDEFVEFLDGRLADVGSDIYNQSKILNWSTLEIDTSHVMHWSWISSYLRDSVGDSVHSCLDKSAMVKSAIMHDRRLRNVCKQCGISYKHLLIDLERKTLCQNS